MRGDGRDVLAWNTGFGDHRNCCIGEPVAEVEVEAAVLVRRRAGEGTRQSLASRAVIGQLAEGEELCAVPGKANRGC
jgi:hypothetical protein